MSMSTGGVPMSPLQMVWVIFFGVVCDKYLSICDVSLSVCWYVVIFDEDNCIHSTCAWYALG